MTDQELQALQAQVDSTPELQALLQQYQRDREGLGLLRGTQLHAQTAPARGEALKAAGIQIPDEYHLDPGTGRVAEDSGIPWWAWTLPAIGVAAPLAFGGAAAGAGGAGTAAGAGTTAGATGAGAGAGTTAAAAGAGGSFLGRLGSGIKDSFLNNPLGALGDIGRVLSGGAAGSANQRMSEGNLARDFGLLNLAGARDQFSAGMQGAQFQREGQDRERKAQMLMALLNGMQDLKLTPGNPKIAAAMGNVAGGARPSALTANKDALMALLAQPQTQAPTYKAPNLPAMPTAGLMEKLGGGAGGVLSILGALGGVAKPSVPVDPMKKYADQGYATGY